MSIETTGKVRGRRFWSIEPDKPKKRTRAVIEAEIRQEEKMAEHHALMAKNLRRELRLLQR